MGRVGGERSLSQESFVHGSVVTKDTVFLSNVLPVGKGNVERFVSSYGGRDRLMCSSSVLGKVYSVRLRTTPSSGTHLGGRLRFARSTGGTKCGTLLFGLGSFDYRSHTCLVERVLPNFRMFNDLYVGEMRNSGIGMFTTRGTIEAAKGLYQYV